MPTKLLTASNQTQTLIKTASGTKITDAETVLLPHASYPFIDKLSVTLMLPDELRKDITENVESAIKCKSIFQPGPYSRRYKVSRMIACDGTNERVLFQFGAKTSTASDCRIEFNPSKMGWDGVQSLYVTLLGAFPDGWMYFVENGRVSRIDIADDVFNVAMDGFLPLADQGLTFRRFSRDGRLQTLYFGSPESNQTRIYSKSDEQKANGHPTAQSVVRVEKTLRNLTLKVCELPKLPNPFVKIALVESCPNPPPWESARRWAMFQDSIIVRGLSGALALQSPSRRTKYRKYLKQHQQLWWDPGALWKDWPTAVADVL